VEKGLQMDKSRVLEAIRQGCIDPFFAAQYHKDSPSPPPAPDYTGAAQATAAGNLEAARFGTKANRVDTYTPYGSLNYSQPNPDDPDQWRADVNLSDTGRQLLGYQDAASLGLGEQTTQALGRVDQSLSQPFDYGSVGDIQNAAQGAVTSRLDPMFAAREESTQAQLYNQGLRPGMQAYDEAMRNFNVGRNDAYQQAIMAGINTMPQTYQMASSLRNQPLNELNALRTGSQVTNPTFQQAPQQQTTTGANLLGAAQSQGQAGMDAYNSQVGQNNAMMGGLFSLGGAALGAPVGTFGRMFG